MPRYYFHLITPEERSPDESGCELPNVEQAYLEVYRAALDISFEMLHKRRDPAYLRFEVTNESGELLFDLPFSEALRPTRRPACMTDLRMSIERGAQRHRKLTSELKEQFHKTRSTILATRALLAQTVPH